MSGSSQVASMRATAFSCTPSGASSRLFNPVRMPLQAAMLSVPEAVSLEEPPESFRPGAVGADDVVLVTMLAPQPVHMGIAGHFVAEEAVVLLPGQEASDEAVDGEGGGDDTTSRLEHLPRGLGEISTRVTSKPRSRKSCE